MSFLVRAVQREHFKGYYSAQRFWPSGSDIEIEVLGDTEDDPYAPRMEPPGAPIPIGQRTWRELQDEGFLRIIPKGGDYSGALEVTELRKLNAELAASIETKNVQIARHGARMAELEPYKARADELEGKLAELQLVVVAGADEIKAAIAARDQAQFEKLELAERLEGENAQLRAQVAKLSASQPAPNAVPQLAPAPAPAEEKPATLPPVRGAAKAAATAADKGSSS